MSQNPAYRSVPLFLNPEIVPQVEADPAGVVDADTGGRHRSLVERKLVLIGKKHIADARQQLLVQQLPVNSQIEVLVGGARDGAAHHHSNKATPCFQIRTFHKRPSRTSQRFVIKP
ncbi:hypothetical protein [Telluribacter sp.]|uniref:hypothetical protein n=1 Tax=Telluribacter sp. TaxID=1978767 RepID=UPI002E13BD4C|nr:hypothetical protein [Telluribacter sp.]